ncbi:MAG: class I SAM-dependent methyltransferase [Chlorobiales bacterium]|nr:class I SAM-dependent methyltransferase [Chlorobiales bacterium]
MLQLKTAGYIAIDNLRKRLPFPPQWHTNEELEKVADRYHSAFLDERLGVSRNLGASFFAAELLDRSIRTDEEEHMDDPAVPPQKKLELIKALDNMNNMLSLYRQYISVIEPSIRKIVREKKRPARILELASGAGGLAFAIAAQAKLSMLPVEITGSDIVPEYVDYCNAKAEERNLPVRFSVINAFAMESLENCSCDIILISQSLHHFTPGKLARIIEQSKLHGASIFLGLDGHRGLDLLAGVPLIAMLQGVPALTLDGCTSARKFYSEPELDLIAEIATGSKRHRVDFSWPLTVLRIPFG